MVFSSLTFLFVFLPIVLFSYYLIFVPYLLTRKAPIVTLANLVLFIASLIFYFWGQGWFVILMMVSAVLDYACGLLIDFAKHSGRFSDRNSKIIARAVLAVSITGSLTILGVFKYFNFGASLVQGALGYLFGKGAAVAMVHLPQIILPLGISFYTFQTMSYTIDVYRGVVRANRNFIDYSTYVTMYPQLVAGPIVRYKDIDGQLGCRTINFNKFASGVERLCVGLAKKVVIANSMAIVADGVFSIPANSLTMPLAWAGVLAYTLQIYFDFSGYSDMAIGLGRMLGFEFMENFNYPYIAGSIQEFWRRWHISLSSWFRDYLYIPLGGNRLGNIRTYINLGIVFFLVGLWHGAAVRFVVWGLYNGAFLILERMFLGNILERLWRPLRSLYVLAVVVVGWVIFRADSMAHAASFLKVMVKYRNIEMASFFDKPYINNETIFIFILGVIGSIPVGRMIKDLYSGYSASHRSLGAWLARAAFSSAFMAFLAFTFGLSIMLLASGTYNPFIYFRF